MEKSGVETATVGTGTAVQKSGDLSVSTMRAIRVRFIPCHSAVGVKTQPAKRLSSDLVVRKWLVPTAARSG